MDYSKLSKITDSLRKIKDSGEPPTEMGTRFAWINLMSDLGDLLVEYDPSKANEDTVISALEAIIKEGYSQMPEEGDEDDDSYEDASYELRQKVFNASGDGWEIVAYNSEGDRWESMEFFIGDPNLEGADSDNFEENIEKVYGEFEEWVLDF